MKTEDLVVGKLYCIKRLNPRLYFFANLLNKHFGVYNFKIESKEEIFLFLGLGAGPSLGAAMLRFSTKNGIEYFFSLDLAAKLKLENVLHPIEGYE